MCSKGAVLIAERKSRRLGHGQDEGSHGLRGCGCEVEDELPDVRRDEGLYTYTIISFVIRWFLESRDGRVEASDLDSNYPPWRKFTYEKFNILQCLGKSDVNRFTSHTFPFVQCSFAARIVGQQIVDRGLG
jgi:hypothetical protein